MKMNKQLILVRGIPGSGKSTLARNLDIGLESVHLEADMYFMYNTGKYIFDVTKLHQAHQWCMGEARKFLIKDHVVIVSNTFTTIKELRPYFELGLEFDLLPVVYLAQNQFKNVHAVPEENLQKMKTRFVYDISPLMTEFQLKLLEKDND